LTRPFPFLTEPQWHQGQSPRLCPLRLQGQFCRSFSLSWQSFTMSRTLHPSIGLLRCLRPPSHTLAFSRPPTRQSSVGVPQFQSIRRVEIPVAACCRPGALGTTYGHSHPAHTMHHPVLGQVSQPISPVWLHGLSSQVPCVSKGIRSGRSTHAWLRVAELLSLGFPPSQVPPMSAGQVDLTPLFTCNPLNGLSLCPVKGRTWLKPGASRDLHPCISAHMQLGLFSASAFKVLPDRLPVRTTDFAFQRAACSHRLRLCSF
jgi:hypothetical protein